MFSVSEKVRHSFMPNVGGTAEPFVFRPSLWMEDFFIFLHPDKHNHIIFLYKRSKTS
jgi:hypothetical protein